MVAWPLAVWAGLKEPQPGVPGAGVQLTVQSTPAFVEALATAALIGAVVPTVMVAGGDCTKETETLVTMFVIDRATTALLVASPVDVAVMVTVLPTGTAVGAV